MSLSIELIDDSDFISPFCLKNSRPSFFVSSRACFVGCASCVNAVFKEVPASLPDLKPLAASVSSAAVVSSKFRPTAFAAAPPCARPCEKNDTSAVVLFAAVANASATWLASAPFRLNRFSACATVVAASERFMPPACDIAIVPFNAPIVCSVDRPPFASSASAPAAAVAPTPVFAPRSFALSPSRLKSRLFAFVTAWTSLIAFWKSIAFFTL